MRKLRALEDVLIRVESALAVVLVLTMLLLAAYNVVYRNVLVPLQQHWAHSGPPVEPTSVEAVPAKSDAPPAGDAKAEAEAKAEPEAKVDSAREGGADDFGGFGGGLGEEDEGEPEAKAEPAKPAKPAKPAEPAEPAKPAKAEPDDFGGFGGGLGDDEPEDAAEPDTKVAAPAGDDFAGFGGGLGEDGGDAKAPEAKAVADAKAPAADDELEADEFGEDDLGDDDQFANLPDIDAAAKQSADAIPQGGPPPPGSFAAWAVAFIDDIKLDWIDIFLRQLVIIVAFFGAMLATQRGKHINVDALGKLLPRSARRVVGVLLPLTAVAVCLVLAKAGWDLVSISREYPKDILPSVPEWSLQLMFPVGFGLLAVHFVVRMVEAVVVGPPEPEPPRVAAPPPAAASDEADADSDDDDDERDAASQKGGR